MNERTALFVDAMQRLDLHGNNNNKNMLENVYRASKERHDDDDNTTITTAVETRDASAASKSKEHKHEHQAPGHRRSSSSCSSISGPVFLWTKGDTPVELGIPAATTTMPSSLLVTPLEPSTRRTRTTTKTTRTRTTTTRRHQRHQSFQDELFLDDFYTTGSLNDGSVDAASTRSHVSMPIDLDVMDDYYRYSGQQPWTTVGASKTNKDNDEDHAIPGEKQETKMESTKHHGRVIDLDAVEDLDDDDDDDKCEPLPLIRNPLCRRPSGGIDALVQPPNRMTRFEI